MHLSGRGRVLSGRLCLTSRPQNLKDGFNGKSARFEPTYSREVGLSMNLLTVLALIHLASARIHYIMWP